MNKKEPRVFKKGTKIDFNFTHVPNWGCGVPRCSLGKGYFYIGDEESVKGWYEIKGNIDYHFDDKWYGKIPFSGSFQLIGIQADIFIKTFNGYNWHFIEHHNFDQSEYPFEICTFDTHISAL